MTPEEMAPGFEFRPAWRLADPTLEADVLAFWKRLDLLPADVKPEERVKELVTVVYKDGEVAGVHTAAIGLLPQVRTKLAMVRSAVDPAHRRTRIAWAMTLHGRNQLEAWGREHPEERLGGPGAVIASRQPAERGGEAYWPAHRLTPVRYP